MRLTPLLFGVTGFFYVLGFFCSLYEVFRTRYEGR